MMIIGFVSGMLCISDNAASIVALMAIIVEAGAQGLTGGLELTHKTTIRNSNSDANQNFQLSISIFEPHPLQEYKRKGLGFVSLTCGSVLSVRIPSLSTTSNT